MSDSSDSRRDLAQGLIYAHNRANMNTAEVHQSNAKIQALVEMLVERGVIEEDELDQRQQVVSEDLRRSYVERGMAVAMQEFGVSKYEFDGAAEIDCASRLHLCEAACCRLPLALSREDVREGIVEWELGNPYMIAQAEDGYCVHLDRSTHRCGVYCQRPIPCRGYDCREDSRIWLDFEGMVINPTIHDPDWPELFEVDVEEGAAT